MDWRIKVTSAIKEGIRAACSDIPTYTENWSGTLAAEYLLTVRVAEAVLGLNKQPPGGIGFPFKVYIEERTEDFIRKCIPIRPITNYNSHRRIYRAVRRKGKVDIAVTHDASPSPAAVPVCIIEIKGFDPALKKIHDDLVRNADFMTVAALTSRNDLFTLLVALHEGKAVKAADREKDINRAKKKYCRAVGRLRSRLRGIRVDCDAFSAEEEFGLVADPVNTGEEDCRHHFVGVIVSFHRAAPDV